MEGDHEIAVVGIGCRFPGADNIDEYWRVLENSENHVLDIPRERWNNDAFYSENKDEPGKHYVKRAGFLNKHDEWDNRLFGVSENEASRIDPQQRYVLECAHMAMEDGGITRKEMAGSSTGVYIGVMNDDYKVLASSDHDDDTNYSATGMSTTIIASRVSYVYNLQGPCMVIDTACSSSMIAIHLGSQAILTGDCEMAICGGVSSILSPDTFMALCKARMMSATGQCQTFCDTADGYARGEGCGVVILKSLKKALAEGNKIWGVLKTGSNQDGHMMTPITAPSGEQQEELLKKVYTQYNVNPTKIQYIEVHGTGTPIGDPTEANALGHFITSQRNKPAHTKAVPYRQVSTVSVDSGRASDADSSGADSLENSDNEREAELFTITETGDHQESLELENGRRPSIKQNKVIQIGSVKSNIGHTESAAGVAGVIKVLLMMRHGKIVPSLHVKKDKSNVNKKILLDEYGLDIALEVRDWKTDRNGDRISCVNSFGFGGSNSHAIVIQRAGFFGRSRPVSQYNNKKGMNNIENPFNFFSVSAMDKASLKNSLENFKNDLQDSDVDLNDVAYTSVFHRDQYPSRTIAYGRNIEEISEHVKRKADTIDTMKSKTKTRITFVFCGVGTTWTGMCKEMMTTQPVFKSTVQQIDQYLKPLAGWGMAEKFENNDTDYSDPFLNHVAIFCTQVALFEWWRSMGIFPSTIIGQSVGEVAAAYASGALPLLDAVDVIYYRSKILAEQTGGKMMVVGNYSVEKLEELCESHDNKVTIAVYNSPASCTLSGDAEVMDTIKSELENLSEKDDLNLLIRPLSVQCAYHSNQVESCMETIVDQLGDIQAGVRHTNHISTVTGELADGDDFQTGTYWAENIRKPVQFMQSVMKTAEEGVTNVYIELGPRQVLRAHLANILGENLMGLCLPSMNAKKECVSAFTSLSELYEMGVEIDWSSLIPACGNIVSIPKYVFNKVKLLYMPDTAQRMLKGMMRNDESHMYVRASGSEKAEFRINIDKDSTPFVYDHYFFNSILVPGATYVEAAFEVGQRKSKCTAHGISVAVEFVNPFTPPDDKQYGIDIEVTEDEDIDGHRFEMTKDGRHMCVGTITRREDVERPIVDIGPIQERCKTHRSKEDSYKCLEKIDFVYGETLSLIEQSWSTTTECLVEFILPDSVKEQTKTTHIHPSVIDAIFQTFGILSTIGTEGPTLPKGAASIIINRPPQDRMYGYSQMVRATPLGNHYNSLLLSTEGHVIAEVQDFYTKTIRISDAPNQSLVYGVQWNEFFDSQDDVSTEKPDNSAGGKLVVFGSKRFIKCIGPKKDEMDAVSYELNDNLMDTEAMFRLALDQVSAVRAFVFAPCHHIQYEKNAGNSIFNSAKHIFQSFAILMKILREQNNTNTLYVITEEIMSAPMLDKYTTNICGSELWGLSRSALSETVHNDIRLVDMELTSENMSALEVITRSGSVNCNEYMLSEGRIFYTEMIEAANQDQEPNQREMDYVATENLILKSACPDKVTEPHFQLNYDNGKTEPSSCKVRLHTLNLHNSMLYPSSTESDDAEKTIWPDINDDGFQVVALEALGWPEDKGKNTASKIVETTPKLGFCYPVNVSSVVTVPAKCTFDVGKLPVYIPGLMTIGVLLWELMEACKQSTNVLIVCNDDSSTHCHLMVNLLTKHKKCQTRIVTKESISVGETRSNIQAVVVLEKITQKHLSEVQTAYIGVNKIVSIEQFVPRYMQRWAQHNIKSTALTILNTEAMFTHAQLIEKVPKVFNWLKSLDNAIRSILSQVLETFDEDERESGLFELPYPTLPLQDGNNSEEPIPLKVFRSEIFRPNGCYILVGGLTGLGWELLQLLAEYGAGYIATMSRRSTTPEKQAEIDKIKSMYGCTIICVQTDITDLKGLQKSMNYLQSQIGHNEIRGIFHGGGVVHDMLLSSMTEDDIEKPLLPKILGTWNLHVVSKDLPLDFFVMHSSIVAILGNAGQCNYAAGNSFQDSFANYRRSLGLCGQSINWSTLALGMAVESKDVENSFKRQGFFYLSPEDIRLCFIRAIMTNPSQVAFGIFDWTKLEDHATVKLYKYKFKGCLEKYGTKAQGFKKTDAKYQFEVEEFKKLEDDEKRRAMIINLLKLMIGDTFVVDNDTLDEETRFVTLGIDSMAAMSFTNTIFDTTQVRIPVVTLLSDATTIGTLATFIVDNIKNGTTGESQNLTEDTTHLREFLSGNVTFSQRGLLGDYLKNPYSKNFMRQADYEVTGLNLKPKDWRTMLNHLLAMNPDLRRIYTLDSEVGYDSILLPMEKVDVDLEEVPFDSICTENTTDDRDKIHFDLTKELPIKFKLACKSKKTRMRLYIHSVISDLSGVAMLFRDIGSYMKPYICKEPLPEKDTDIVPAEAIRTALGPRLSDMKQYWKLQLSQDVRPFTFGKDDDLDAELEETNWYQVKRPLPTDLVNTLMNYIAKTGSSLYNFMMALYMIVLNQRTKLDLIPIVTNVDMRGHVSQLKSMVTRCTNAIPVIGDLRNMGKVSEYFKRSADRMHTMTQQSGYPYALIEEEMQTDELRKHVGRHRLVMDNLANLNQVFKHKRVTVKMSNVFHTRQVYESSLYIVYDLQEKTVALEYGYNCQMIKHEDAATIPTQMMNLMAAFIDNPDASMTDILEGHIVTEGLYSQLLDTDVHNDDYIMREKDESNNEKHDSNKNGLSATHTGSSKDFIVLHEDLLRKQTSLGWDHGVHVTLARDSSTRTNGELLLVWRKINSDVTRSLNLNTVSEVQVKKLNNVYGLLFKQPSGWLVLKCRTLSQASQWLNHIKAASEPSRSDKNNIKTAPAVPSADTQPNLSVHL